MLQCIMYFFMVYRNKFLLFAFCNDKIFTFVNPNECKI